MILPFLDPQMLDVEVLDEFYIYDNVPYNNKCPIILNDDPLVIKLGAKIGQVIRFNLLLPDKLPYIEIHYRKVATL